MNFSILMLGFFSCEAVWESEIVEWKGLGLSWYLAQTKERWEFFFLDGKKRLVAWKEDEKEELSDR